MVQFIESVAVFGCFVLQLGKDRVPDSMERAVLKLHDSLLHLESESPAQDAIAKLCEAWYVQDCPSKREVVPQTILYLLMRSVGDKGKLSDVKRVHGMREGLLHIEIGDESFRSVQESIMRASIHPHFILNDDGRRFLSFVLSLDAPLTRLMHRTIKSQIPLCRFCSPPSSLPNPICFCPHFTRSRALRAGVRCCLSTAKCTTRRGSGARGLCCMSSSTSAFKTSQTTASTPGLRRSQQQSARSRLGFLGVVSSYLTRCERGFP